MSEPVIQPGRVPGSRPDSPQNPSGTLQTLADTIAGLGNEGPETRPGSGAVLRYGTVTAVGTIAPNVGLVQTTSTGDAWLTSDAQYLPLVGDLVYLITQGPVGHVIGRIGVVPRTPDVDIQVFTDWTITAVWTKPTKAPIQSVYVMCQAGGGGGGAGGRGASTVVRTGGGGGGSGSRAERWFSAADLPNSAYNVFVGAAGVGAAPQNTDSTVGAAGTAGVRTGFSNFLYAVGGGAGGGGSISGVAGTAGAGGIGLYPGNAGAASSATGGAGGSAVTTAGPGSGGSGGGLAASASVGTAGGVGQETRAHGVQSQAAAAVGSGTANNNAFATRAYNGAPGNGAPGGASTPSAAAMVGGDANGYGAGGGGGGASQNGYASGGGGAGAPGAVVVITYF